MEHSLSGKLLTLSLKGLLEEERFKINFFRKTLDHEQLVRKLSFFLFNQKFSVACLELAGCSLENI